MEDTTPHRSHRRYFLQDIPLEEATARWFGALNDAGALVQMPGEDAPADRPRHRGPRDCPAGVGRGVVAAL